VSAASRGQMLSLSGSDPRGYRPHGLHSTDRSYLETNCYADIIIELLHACGYEPLAAFGHLVRMDFEGDQWTFFKPPPEDLERLFGIDIHEMQPYRPLPVQIAEQIALGRTLILELDSWWLPDTASTSYHAEHVKTSVAPDAIDPDAQTMHYFHSAGLFELSGEDYRRIFRIERFGAQLQRELPSLLERGLEDYHAYAFATVRMAGSAFEVAADHAAWLFGAGAAEVQRAMGAIVDGCKALSFRLARRRAFDPAPSIEVMAGAWERAMSGLRDAGN